MALKFPSFLIFVILARHTVVSSEPIWLFIWCSNVLCLTVWRAFMSYNYGIFACAQHLVTFCCEKLYNNWAQRGLPTEERNMFVKVTLVWKECYFDRNLLQNSKCLSSYAVYTVTRPYGIKVTATISSFRICIEFHRIRNFVQHWVGWC